MQYAEQTVQTADGRTVEVATLGNPAGRTVVVHHGTPGSMGVVRFFESIAEGGAFFFVGASRPGCGLSTRQIGRTVASVVGDVDEVLDLLGRDRYVSLGWSGGGPHALACAALDRPRCVGAISLAGVVPLDVDFDWTAGMGPENIEEFALAREGGARYEAHMAHAGDQFVTASAANIVELFGELLSERDREVLGDESVRATLADECRQTFAEGWYGFYDDDRAFFSPWGFDPTTMTAPVAVWYGDEDLMVPPTHGAWLGEHIAGAAVSRYRDDGHISLITDHLEDLAASLAQLFDEDAGRRDSSGGAESCA